MRKAIVLTAYNRPDYLAETLDSWLRVRDLRDWDFYISIDESEDQDIRAEILQICNYFQQQCKGFNIDTNVTVLRNSPKLGVLKHPYIVLDTLFGLGYDFVLRTEDDLVVSDGILEYFDWAARTFADMTDAATVHGFAEGYSDDEKAVTAEVRFNPWVFGTWKRAWPTLKENWDLDYSTYETRPMDRSGFDHNFNLRVYPKKGLRGIYPSVSRVKNIGVWGVHGTPENLPHSPSFIEHNEIFEYYDILV